MGIEAIMLIVVTSVFGLKIFADQYEKRQLQRTIDRQQDTIQRLINREPVTYSEVGRTPTKPSREVYAAWGNQTVNLDEDERQ